MQMGYAAIMRGVRTYVRTSSTHTFLPIAGLLPGTIPGTIAGTVPGNIEGNTRGVLYSFSTL